LHLNKDRGLQEIRKDAIRGDRTQNPRKDYVYYKKKT